jgi:hypothetical protein
MKTRRRFLKTSWLGRSLALFVILVTPFFLFRSDFFKIKKISCFLDQDACSHLLWTGIFELASDELIFSTNKTSLEKEILKRNPELKSVSVQIRPPDALVVRIEKRRPLMEVVFLSSTDPVLSLRSDQKTLLAKFEEEKERENQSFFLSQDKTVLEREGEALSLPKILVKTLSPIEASPGTKLTQSSFAPGLETLSLLLSKESDLNFGLIDDENQNMVIFASSWQAFFSLAKDPIFQVDSLQLIFKQAKIEGKFPKSVDLRFEKPVVIFTESLQKF